jgi:heavy metal sensor kinase
MPLRSLRFKLTLWYVLILAAVLISFSGFLYFTLSKSLFRGVDNKLRSVAELIASEASSPTSKFSFGDLDRTLETSLQLRPVGKFIQVLDESGKIGRKSENLRNIQLPVSLHALKNASKGLVTLETNHAVGNTPLRIITLPIFENSHMSSIVQVASSLEDVEDALNTLFIILMITVPTALIVASLGGQFLANKALKPVAQVTQAARAITSQNLNQRIDPPRVKDEIGRLVETFNEMISRLDQSFRQVKQFTSDASHELKTPLTILRGEVEVALRKDRPGPEYQQILRSNLEEINRMSQIVNDLLLLSKADSGEVKLNRRRLPLPAVLQEVVDQIDILAHSKGLDIGLSISAEDLVIEGDDLRIRELFLNLIENGIKYTEPGGAVHIALERATLPPASGNGENPGTNGSNWAKVAVSDTGMGIAPEHLDKIFDRFYRVDKARSREQGGSGLGLSICKWIVEAHHGSIHVESEPGKGSLFVVHLPLAPG